MWVPSCCNLLDLSTNIKPVKPDRTPCLNIVVPYNDVVCLCPGSLQGVYQRRLYKELMRNYNPLERPVQNDSHSLTVHFSFSLLQIMDVVRTHTHTQTVHIGVLSV